MFKQSLPHTFRAKFSTYARFNVIIHLDISHSVIFDYPIDHFIDMFDDFRIPKIELISATIIYTLSMTDKEPVIRSILCFLTIDSHHFKFQPDARYHSLLTNVICYFFNSIRKTLPAFLPFADTVPPFSGSIPTGIYHIVFTTAFRSRINQRKFFLRCRITKQAIHIIVENNR